MYGAERLRPIDWIGTILLLLPLTDNSWCRRSNFVACLGIAVVYKKLWNNRELRDSRLNENDHCRAHIDLYTIFPYILTHYDLLFVGDIHLIPSRCISLSVYRETAWQFGGKIRLHKICAICHGLLHLQFCECWHYLAGDSPIWSAWPHYPWGNRHIDSMGWKLDAFQSRPWNIFLLLSPSSYILVTTVH